MTFKLLPNSSASFQLAFFPKRQLRETFAQSSTSMSAAKPEKQSGKLLVKWSTGQSLIIPIRALLQTPFISGSSPRMVFGTCHTSFHTDGLLLLSNPTVVAARWTVTHVPSEQDTNGNIKRPVEIRVRGFEPRPTQVDDPSVFSLSDASGLLEGPTVSVTAALACLPNDLNRDPNFGIVDQRLVKASWATQTLTLSDSVAQRHSLGATRSTPAEARFPAPLNVQFTPKKNVNYCSRFRFTAEFGNSFDVLLEGQGTYEEHEHKPLRPAPRP